MFIAAGCGGIASSPSDAGVDGGRFPACNDSTATNVIEVRGAVGDIDETCAASLPSDYTVTWLGNDSVTTMTTLTSTFRLGGLPNEELTLRMARAGSIPRLKPLHPWGCVTRMGAFVVPTPNAANQVLAPIGGFDGTKAYLVVYAEGAGDPNQQSLCVGNVAGFSITSSSGATHYTDATGTKLDPNATATSTSGFAIVVVDGAPTFGNAPSTVRVDAKRAGSTPSCKILPGQGWERGDLTSQTEFAADAPALAGHFTYALYITCH